MVTKIKICGLKTERDIEIINKYDVDYIGFVFAESKRKVTKEKAKDMVSKLRKDIKAVGVFVNSTKEEINEVVDFCGLDIIQLHGKETTEFSSCFDIPVWKAFSIKDKASLIEIGKYHEINGYLLDGLNPGSGKSFDWNIINGFSKDHFTILAGGLNSINVKTGIELVKPAVVDVSSGVEVEGIKNEEKIIEFIRKVKRYGEQ
ncbi:phosphoribosylanthranilate isomerase [Clostridium sp. DL1XJH146]